MSFYFKKDNDLMVDPYRTTITEGYKSVSSNILERLFLHAKDGNKVNQKRNLSHCNICRSKVSYFNCEDLISDYMVILKRQNKDSFYLIPSLIFHTAVAHDVVFPEELIDLIELL